MDKKLITDNDKIKNLLRVISFVKSLGGLYANIADDAMEKLSSLLEQNERYYGEYWKNKIRDS